MVLDTPPTAPEAAASPTSGVNYSGGFASSRRGGLKLDELDVHTAARHEAITHTHTPGTHIHRDWMSLLPANSK